MNIIKVMMFFIIIYSSSLSAEWKVIGGNDKMTSYTDLSTKKKINNFVRIWSLYDFNELQHPETGEEFLSIKSYNEFNCREDKYRTLSYVWYSANMGSGSVVYSSDNSIDWKYIVPNSILHTLSEIACK